MELPLEHIKTFLVNGAFFVGSLGIVAVVLLYFNQNKLLYIPNPPGFPKEPRDNPPGYSSPGEWTKKGGRCKPGESDANKIPFEEHFVNTPDGEKIHVWLLLQDLSNKAVTLIYFHGNAANMGLRLKNAAEMYAFSGVNVLMMDYRGYGSSTGVPTEEGLNMDADAVTAFARSHTKLLGSPLVAFGRSLGGAVSFALTARQPDVIRAVVVENTFESVAAMVDVLMPVVAPLKWLVLRIGWRSDLLVPELKQPILFISGDADQLVPPKQMKRLYDLARASSGREFFSVGGGTHNDTWEVGGMLYYQKIADFVLQLLGQMPAPTLSASSEDLAGTCRRRRKNGGGGGGEEGDDAQAIPTMGTDFSVQ